MVHQDDDCWVVLVSGDGDLAFAVELASKYCPGRVVVLSWRDYSAEFPVAGGRGAAAEWTCAFCTLLNPPLAPLCAACGCMRCAAPPEAN